MEGLLHYLSDRKGSMKTIGKPERMGGKRTFLLAAGAFLGVLAMSGIIHLIRKQKPEVEE